MGAKRSYEKLAFAAEIYHITSSLTASYVLTKLQQTCVVDATSSSGAISVYLPPASECMGMIFTVRLTTLATSSAVVYEDQYGASALGNGTLDTSGDWGMWCSDGITWRSIGGNGT